jgi:regulator of sirC expression with transglutaminase-like and TPR domain
MLAKIMQIEEVRAIVNKTNNFTKEELAANRSLIKLVRQEKKDRLAKLVGSQVGMMVDAYRDRGFVLQDVKEKDGIRTDKIQITLSRCKTTTEADRLKEQIQKLQEKLNRVTAVNV